MPSRRQLVHSLPGFHEASHLTFLARHLAHALAVRFRLKCEVSCSLDSIVAQTCSKLEEVELRKHILSRSRQWGWTLEGYSVTSILQVLPPKKWYLGQHFEPHSGDRKKL